MELTMDCVREGEYGLECGGETIYVHRILVVYSEDDMREGNLIVPYKKKLVPLCLTHYTMEKVAKQEMKTLFEGAESKPSSGIYSATIPDDQMT